MLSVLLLREGGFASSVRFFSAELGRIFMGKVGLETLDEVVTLLVVVTVDIGVGITKV